MKGFSEEIHERHAAEFCLRVAFKKLKEDDVELALFRAEEAVRSLKVLQQIKKAN